MTPSGPLRYLLPLAGAALLAALLIAPFARQPRMAARSDVVMGRTPMTVKVVEDAHLSVPAEEALRQAVAAVREVDALMSAHRPESEIARLNRLDPAESMALSRPTWEVLLEAERYQRLSGGAFDITVGPLLALYRFKETEEQRRTVESFPSPEEIAAARARVGSGRVLELIPAGRRARRIDPGARIDLGAIAKGYAVDRAAETLLRLGARHFLVEIGGEVRVAGQAYGTGKDGAPGWRPWSVPIQNPSRPDEPVFLATLHPSETAIATSGNYQQYFEYEGKRYSHIIDPRTGLPVSSNLAGVTVLAPGCTRADALATALSVLGVAEGRELLEARFPGVKALFQIQRSDGSIETVSCPAEWIPGGMAEDTAKAAPAANAP